MLEGVPLAADLGIGQGGQEEGDLAVVVVNDVSKLAELRTPTIEDGVGEVVRDVPRLDCWCGAVPRTQCQASATRLGCRSKGTARGGQKAGSRHRTQYRNEEPTIVHKQWNYHHDQSKY